MPVKRWLVVATLIGWCGGAALPAQAAQEETLSVATEDPELQEQISQVNQALEEIHQQLVARKKALQMVLSDAQKARLYDELDGLRRERDMLERLLHDLVDEAQATEWTAIDEALKRARAAERPQERAVQREENLRERAQ